MFFESFFLKESEMDKKELAYVKQTVSSVKDWDAYQAVIRHLTRMQRRYLPKK